MQENEPVRAQTWPSPYDKEIQLTIAEQERFAEALLNPPQVAPALRIAMENRERLLDIR